MLTRPHSSTSRADKLASATLRRHSTESRTVPPRTYSRQKTSADAQGKRTRAHCTPRLKGQTPEQQRKPRTGHTTSEKVPGRLSKAALQSSRSNASGHVLAMLCLSRGKLSERREAATDPRRRAPWGRASRSSTICTGPLVLPCCSRPGHRRGRCAGPHARIRSEVELLNRSASPGPDRGEARVDASSPPSSIGEGLGRSAVAKERWSALLLGALESDGPRDEAEGLCRQPEQRPPKSMHHRGS
mmetsp:Transcript_22950/g.53023  ORF Transcript_22950/g.53023 Transcript_22950/m.53023 type:complete len:244 (+) Transcript_22950:199-930(+)